jgi:Short C-terminal domain
MFGKDKLLREGAEAQALVLDKKVRNIASEPGRDGLKAYATFGIAGDWANVGDALSCTYSLRVRFEDGSTTEISRHVRGVSVSWVPVGDLLPVRYDPADRSKIEVDEPALKARRDARARDAKADAIARGEAELGQVAGSQSASAGSPSQEAEIAESAKAFREQSEAFRQEAAAFAERSAAFRSRSAGAPGIEALEAIMRAKASGDQAEVDRLKAEFKRSVADNPGSPGVPVLGGASGAPDPVERLEKLADLRDRGALTDAEFAAQKAKILGES